jgi:hypothetical protein
LQLSSEEKLKLLKELDRWRQWRSLDDQRLCLGCGRLINGHEVEAIPAEANKGDDAELHCPTDGCQSIPLDWILPTRREHKTNHDGTGR